MAFPLYFDEDSVNRALIRALVARGMDVTNAIDVRHAGDGRLVLLSDGDKIDVLDLATDAEQAWMAFLREHGCLCAGILPSS